MSLFDFPQNVSPLSVCNNDRASNNVAVLVQLSDGEISASKPTAAGASTVVGASTVLANTATGVQSHGKHA